MTTAANSPASVLTPHPGARICTCDIDAPKLRGVCINCYNCHMRRLNPAQYSKRLAAHKEWRSRNKERLRELDRAYRQSESYRMKTRDKRYLADVKRKYRLSAADHAALFELQKGRCGICHVHQDAIGERLAVDHSHATGEVRGLLCRACNSGLGYHEKRGTGAWSNYTAFPPMRELLYRRNTPEHEQVHPY